MRAILVAGVGFFTDSYDIFAVSLLTTMLGIVYYPSTGKMPVSSDTAIKLATSAGTVIGQFGFGALADIVRFNLFYWLGSSATKVALQLSSILPYAGTWI